MSASNVCTVYTGSDAPRPLVAFDRISDVLQIPDTFVWLDIVDPQPADFAIVEDEFALHPLAIEDALNAHQRPKIEAYGDSWFVVVDGATRTGNVLELHELAIFAGAKFVVTVRARPAFPFDEIERRWGLRRSERHRGSAALLYTILDTIVDGYATIGEAFEEHVESLEAALLREGTRTSEVLLEIFNMKNELARFRRAIVPMHDILAPIVRGDLSLFAREELPYYRDIGDHVSRVVDRLDAVRDLVNNARDTHIAIASNRQNEVAKQLTIVATIFLPLTFITGFFGQNFAFLVSRIATAGSFWWLGIGTELAAFAALLAYFRYKRWF